MAAAAAQDDSRRQRKREEKARAKREASAVADAGKLEQFEQVLAERGVPNLVGRGKGTVVRTRRAPIRQENRDLANVNALSLERVQPHGPNFKPEPEESARDREEKELPKQKNSVVRVPSAPSALGFFLFASNSACANLCDQLFMRLILVGMEFT